MRDNLEKSLNIMVAVAAIVVAAVVVHRELAARTGTAAPKRTSVSVPNWREILPVARVIGDSSAPIKIIEFADFECPFCRSFNRTVQTLTTKYPRDVAVYFVHLPLSFHRFARPAARAAECAYGQGRFGPFVDRAFEKQDSLGLKSWVSYAREAGVHDTVGYATCVSDTATLHAVEAGVAMAERFGVQAHLRCS